MLKCPAFNLLSNSKKVQKLHKSNHENRTFFVKLRLRCITTVEIHSSSNDWILFLMETKDKAVLFKGYMAGLFSSQDGTSLHITDWRNAAWWNVPVKLGECDALKKEAMNIFWKCWQFSQPEYEAWLWKISFQRRQQCNKSERESPSGCLASGHVDLFGWQICARGGCGVTSRLDMHSKELQCRAWSECSFIKPPKVV